MKKLLEALSRLFRRKQNPWDSADYGKPSTAGDDFRDRNVG